MVTNLTGSSPVDALPLRKPFSLKCSASGTPKPGSFFDVIDTVSKKINPAIQFLGEK